MTCRSNSSRGGRGLQLRRADPAGGGSGFGYYTVSTGGDAGGSSSSSSSSRASSVQSRECEPVFHAGGRGGVARPQDISSR